MHRPLARAATAVGAGLLVLAAAAGATTGATAAATPAAETPAATAPAAATSAQAAAGTAAQATTATGATSVGLHNAYIQATFPYLADALDTGAGMLEIDIWTNFFGTRDFKVSHDPGNSNNCAAANTYPELRTGARNQNLATCLRNIRLWHENKPNHPLVVLKLELKNGFDGRGGFGAQQLDRVIADNLGAANVFGPAQLKGSHPTLDAAAQAGAWPTRAALTGKFLILVERGTFEAANPFDRYHTDVEYADRLINANSAGALPSTMAFPAINGASQSDPRTGDRGADRASWLVAFDGDASAYAGYPGSYLGGKYLVVMTDAHRVAPAIDGVNPPVPDAQARVRDLAAKGATIVSSDWRNPAIASYTTG
ncbi:MULTISPECIES: phosphatidylinositol-specific phospholipase C domain-containing protein [unclassified Crossiella]|uniref:phosphatidylinositol-specific phospholipase C domain-containing protein n=1 Tax=unclassified Crossiella TaxID=2620835 RepID=UPI001FFE4D3B|nr:MULTISPECIES: phosphatidylinositol-specific phospholipase C domain-containing protein [unclassified Crossiella]MCK2239612.1 Ca2+-dependent phosphoinositide-specific phospholipase C [Crossiella sp. S99.2]MCK2252307.1 Ca2+-dependent phosphoinositide-specific phospholipase C [Crossiella sp. S99.1]